MSFAPCEHDSIYDVTSDEEPIDKKIKIEVKDAGTGLIEVIAKPDVRVNMLSIRIVLEDDKVVNGKSWKRIGVFSTIVTY